MGAPSRPNAAPAMSSGYSGLGASKRLGGALDARFNMTGSDLHNMFGFQQNQVTLQDAFNFKSFDGFPNLREHNFKHVNLQNGKLWALTNRNEIIAKADINNLDKQLQPIDDFMIKRKNIKKMFVNRLGNHCFMLAEHEIFYNNWSDG